MLHQDLFSVGSNIFPHAAAHQLAPSSLMGSPHDNLLSEPHASTCTFKTTPSPSQKGKHSPNEDNSPSKQRQFQSLKSLLHCLFQFWPE